MISEKRLQKEGENEEKDRETKKGRGWLENFKRLKKKKRQMEMIK